MSATVHQLVMRVRSALSSGDPKRIESSISDLGSDPSFEASETLVSVLSETNREARRQAAAQLAHRGDSIIPLIEQRLAYNNLDLVYWSCQVLAHLGPPAEALLERQLRSSNPQHRRYTIHALAIRKGERAVELLIQALDEPSWINRKRAADCLAEREDKDVTAKVLRTKMAQGNRNQVYWGVRILAQLMGERVLQILEKLLKHPDWDVRTMAVASLGLVRSSESLPLLLQALQDPSEPVREKSAAVLSVMGSQAVESLIESSRSGNREARYWSLRTLLRLDPDRGKPVAEELVGSKDIEVRHAAVRALAHVPGDHTRELLFRAFKDPSWTVREQASNHLAATGEVVVPLLEEGSKNDDQDVVFWCVSTLGKLGTAGLPRLRTMLSHPDQDVRSFIIEALAESPSPEAMELLVRSVRDPGWPIRRQAATVLSRQGPRAGKAVLLKMFSTHPDERHWARVIFKEIFGNHTSKLIESFDRLPEFERSRFLEVMDRAAPHEMEGMLALDAEDILDNLRIATI